MIADRSPELDVKAITTVSGKERGEGGVRGVFSHAPCLNWNTGMLGAENGQEN